MSSSSSLLSSRPPTSPLSPLWLLVLDILAPRYQEKSVTFFELRKCNLVCCKTKVWNCVDIIVLTFHLVIYVQQVIRKYTYIIRIGCVIFVRLYKRKFPRCNQTKINFYFIFCCETTTELCIWKLHHYKNFDIKIIRYVIHGPVSGTWMLHTCNKYKYSTYFPISFLFGLFFMFIIISIYRTQPSDRCRFFSRKS